MLNFKLHVYILLLLLITIIIRIITIITIVIIINMKSTRITLSFSSLFFICFRLWTRGKIQHLQYLSSAFPLYTRKIAFSDWLKGSKLQRTRRCNSAFGRILSSLGPNSIRYGLFLFRNVLFLNVKKLTVRPRQVYHVGEAPLSLRVAIITYMVSKGISDGWHWEKDGPFGSDHHSIHKHTFFTNNSPS